MLQCWLITIHLKIRFASYFILTCKIFISSISPSWTSFYSQRDARRNGSLTGRWRLPFTKVQAAQPTDPVFRSRQAEVTVNCFPKVRRQTSFLQSITYQTIPTDTRFVYKRESHEILLQNFSTRSAHSEQTNSVQSSLDQSSSSSELAYDNPSKLFTGLSTLASASPSTCFGVDDACSFLESSSNFGSDETWPLEGNAGWGRFAFGWSDTFCRFSLTSTTFFSRSCCLKHPTRY